MKVIYHTLHTLNHFLSTKWFWKVISFVAIAMYLAPLILWGENINMLIYDNLDSNVVWLKILAESGMIFAENDAIIPNMMNGLPRLSYGSEFNVLLWLYYFFSPIVAYTINEVLIHTIAFFSMFLLINRYVVPAHLRYRHTIVYFTSLVFALQAFWPSAGLSIAALPLMTYIFINIYKNRATKVDWFLLFLLPLYTSFVLVYAFYLGFVIIFMIIDTLYNKRIHRPFFIAFLTVLSLYLLVEYRLVLSMILHNGFISHRTEFDVFFTESFISATRKFYLFFLNGHTTHVKGTQMPLILPFILFAMLLQLFNRRLTKNESLVIITLFAISIMLNVWGDVLGSIYSIPSILLFTVGYMLYKKSFSMLNLTMISIIFISAIYGYTFYEAFDVILEWFPIFKSLSLARGSFTQPLLWGILISLAGVVVYRKLHFQVLFLVIILAIQIYISSLYSWYKIDRYKDLSTFKNYYAPELFEQLKKDIPKDLKDVRFVSYGIEPAVALYNGLYTVDGYSANYPIAYKHAFQKVNVCETKNLFTTNEMFNTLQSKIYTADKIFDDWGSKLYILSIQSSLGDYKKGLVINTLNFNENALLDLGTDYLLSSYKLSNPKNRKLIFCKMYKGEENSWDIYLYKFQK